MKLGFRERKGNGNEGIWGIWGNSIQTKNSRSNFSISYPTNPNLNYREINNSHNSMIFLFVQGKKYVISGAGELVSNL